MLLTELMVRRVTYLIEKVFNGRDESECWEWKNRPQITTKLNGEVVNISLRRAVYEVFVGQIPDFHEVKNTCKNRNCVNPKHLETRISVRQVCKVADKSFAEEVLSGASLNRNGFISKI